MSQLGTRTAPFAARSGALTLYLLGRFRILSVDQELEHCRGRTSERLIALLAIRSMAVSRALVAGLLWPNVADRCAHAALRSTLTRVTRSVPSLVHVSGHELSLDDDVSVDLHDGKELASRLVRHASDIDLDAAVACVPALSADLLPGWYDDWVVEEGESWRQLRLHALESLAAALCERRRFGEAIAAASAAVAGDPLRETARAAMIGIHLAEGNRSEAVREFQRYRSVSLRKLGGEPTDRLRSLVSSA